MHTPSPEVYGRASRLGGPSPVPCRLLATPSQVPTSGPRFAFFVAAAAALRCTGGQPAAQNPKGPNFTIPAGPKLGLPKLGLAPHGRKYWPSKEPVGEPDLARVTCVAIEQSYNRVKRKALTGCLQAACLRREVDPPVGCLRGWRGPVTS